jgi:hypothetical protein
MAKSSVVLYKTAFICILVLFFGISVVSSSDNIVNEEYFINSPLELVNNQNGSPLCNHIVYIGSNDFFNCWIYEGTLGEVPECICNDPAPSLISGATCAIDERIMVVQYDSGQLWVIEPENCEISTIGGGGIGLNGIAYDPVYDKMYGASSDALYEVDPNTGEQSFIGYFNIGSASMISIACDKNGSLYGWDVKFSGESYLYKIDTETGEATIVGGMGMTLLYAQDGDFCKKCDILYLAAYTISGSYLCICNKETGELTNLGQFENNAEVTIFAFPWNYRPVVPTYPYPMNNSKDIPIDTSLSWTCSDPDGDQLTFDVFFGASYPPPLVARNVTQYDPGLLGFETTYYWRIVAWDEHGASASGPIWCFTTEQGCNHPPETPEIEGRRRFKIGEGGIHPYKIYSTDPDGDDIIYVINWSDGTQEVTGPYQSGEEITINLTIPKEKGIYQLFKIKAKDIFGLESDWAILEVTVPRSRAILYSLFQLFFDRFPLSELFLRVLNL